MTSRDECECAHPRVEHDYGRGECYLSGCKCRTFEQALGEATATPTDDEQGWSTADRQAASTEAHRRFDEWAETRGQDVAGASINGFILGAEWWKVRRTVQGETPKVMDSGPITSKTVQGEPTPVRFFARQGGKSQAIIDALLAQANERGIRVEVVYPQGAPTDAEVLAAAHAVAALRKQETGAPAWFNVDHARAALRAAAAVREEGQGHG